MYRLIAFLKVHKHWFLWLLLQTAALFLFMSDGGFRSSLKAYGTNALLGRTQAFMTEGYSYLGLREQNRQLLDEYARLEVKYLSLLRSVRNIEAESQRPELADLSSRVEGTVQTARVVNLRHTQGQAYYLIDKGGNDGIKVDMPVMSAGGVVGTIMATSDAYSIVIPITNAKLRLSCSLKGKGDLGTLMSLGQDAGVALGGLPNYAQVIEGDTVLTSGLSYIFPEGLYVGTIGHQQKEGIVGADAAFATYNVNLGTDFDHLNYVYVLLIPPMQEAGELELRLDSIK